MSGVESTMGGQSQLALVSGRSNRDETLESEREPGVADCQAAETELWPASQKNNANVCVGIDAGLSLPGPGALNSEL